MEMDCNLKKLGKLYRVFEKSVKTGYGLLSSRLIQLINSSWCDRSILTLKRGYQI